MLQVLPLLLPRWQMEGVTVEVMTETDLLDWLPAELLLPGQPCLMEDAPNLIGWPQMIVIPLVLHPLPSVVVK